MAELQIVIQGDPATVLPGENIGEAHTLFDLYITWKRGLIRDVLVIWTLLAAPLIQKAACCCAVRRSASRGRVTARLLQHDQDVVA